MDAVLERILSLIPKKENGDFVFGAKKRFCDSIGIESQTLSDWIAGRSTSYMNKILEIALANDVSTVWLKTGEDVPDDFVLMVKESNEDNEALQILRTNPATRTLLKAGKHLTADQINKFAALMESIPEGGVDINAD